MTITTRVILLVVVICQTTIGQSTESWSTDEHPQFFQTSQIRSIGAECWSDQFGFPGADSWVNDAILWDGKLVMCGNFTTIGLTRANGIATWNGVVWGNLSTDSVLGGMFSATDVGGTLYFCSRRIIYKLLGTDVHIIASADSDLTSVTTYGNKLVVTGKFTKIFPIMFAEVPANRVVQYDGISWSALGTGLNGAVTTGIEYSGDLYVGGSFTTAGGGTANRIAKWNGSAWSSIGGLLGSGGAVPIAKDLCRFGSDLIVAGNFAFAGGVTAKNIARWNGASWSALGTNALDTVRVVATDGVTLWAAGRFDLGGSQGTLVSWNGSTWVKFGPASGAAGPYINTICSYGGIPVVGGSWVNFGDSSTFGVNYTTLQNNRWQPFVTGGLSSSSERLGLHEGRVVISGEFYKAGNMHTPLAVALDSSGWHAMAQLGTQDPDLHTFLSRDGHLYGGATTGLYEWTGATWSLLAVASGTSSVGVQRLVEYQGSVIIAGCFQSLGGALASNIMAWNGSTFSPLGAGVGVAGSNSIFGAAVFQGDLYVGGSFNTAGGTPAAYIARWNGSAWSAIGSGVGGEITDMRVLNNELHIVGQFTDANLDHNIRHVARWDGSTWHGFGSGLDFSSYPITIDTFENQIVVGGFMYRYGTVPVNYLAAWNGVTWQALAGGVGGFGTGVRDILSFNHGLYVAGSYSVAGAKGSGNFAVLYGDGDADGLCSNLDNCPGIYNPGQSDLDGDGIGDVCDACCNNRAGNINCDVEDDVEISDLTALINNLFIGFTPLCCEAEANCDGSGGVDIGDLTKLIDNLFISFTPLAECQ